LILKRWGKTFDDKKGFLYIIDMENNIEFPIGTEQAASLINCSQETVKKHCQKDSVEKLNKNPKSPYLIYRDYFKYLKDKIKPYKTYKTVNT